MRDQSLIFLEFTIKIDEEPLQAQKIYKRLEGKMPLQFSYLNPSKETHQAS